MEQQAEITLKIDGREVAVPAGVTILEAARLHGVRIPTLCHHPALTAWGGCRMCVVQVDGAPRLAASCVMPVRQGMDVVTSNPAIIEARRLILEFLFSERNHYCMFCAQSGDCELQSLAYEYQMDHLTVPPLDQNFPVDTTQGDLVMDANRCVLCGRCVRACREIAGCSVLGYGGRGGKSMIRIDLAGELAESTCTSCGACLQVCPTGAIFNRHRTHMAVKGKTKDWRTVESNCPLCGLLCPAEYYLKANNLLKIEGHLGSSGPDRGQLCHLGRFEPLMNQGTRLLEPMIKDVQGRWQTASWDTALDKAVGGLTAFRQTAGGQTIFGLISSYTANEELNLFKKLIQKLEAGYLDTLDGRHARNVAALKEGTTPLKEASWAAILESDLILVVGADPLATHPVIAALIRRAIYEGKAGLAVIGPENPMGPWAKIHLPVTNEQKSSLLQALQPAGNKVPQSFLDEWGPRGLNELKAGFQAAQRPIIIVGQGLTGLASPEGFFRAVDLARAKGPQPDGALRLIILKPAGNSAGAWGLGLAAGHAQAIQGQFRAGLLCLAREDELKPETAADLKGLEFLVAVTPFFTETLADIATVLLPKPIWLEEDGTFTSTDGANRSFKPRVLAQPPGIMPVKDTLTALADRLGLGLTST